jgi:WD40 repeat protein
VWDLTGPTPVATVLAGHTRAVNSAVFSSDGKRVVTASSDNTARVWDLTGPAPVATILAGHTNWVNSASFSPDGKRVVTASLDNTVRLWDLTGASPLVTVLAGHTPPGAQASFSPDGKSVVIASRAWSLLLPTSSYDNTAVILPTPSDTDLVRLARRSLTRCLTIAQREAFGLPVEGPHDADRDVIHKPPCSATGLDETH